MVRFHPLKKEQEFEQKLMQMPTNIPLFRKKNQDF